MNTILLQIVLNNIREPQSEKDTKGFINILIDRKAWKDIFRVMKENSWIISLHPEMLALKIHGEGSSLEESYKISQVMHSNNTKDHN